MHAIMRKNGTPATEGVCATGTTKIFQIRIGHRMPTLLLSVTRLACVVGIAAALCVGLTPALWAQRPNSTPRAGAPRFTIDVIQVSALIVLRSILKAGEPSWGIEPHVVSGLITLHLHRAPYDAALKALLAAARPQLVVRQDSSSGRPTTVVSLLHPQPPARDPGRGQAARG